MKKQLLTGVICASFLTAGANANDLPFVPVTPGTSNQPQAVTLPAPVAMGQIKQVAQVGQAKPKEKRKPKTDPNNPYEIADSARDIKPGVTTRFNLPRLGATGGKPAVINQNVIRMNGNDNQAVYLSYRMPNRISTPFTKPTVIDMTNTGFQVVGQDVYVAPSKGDPVGVFIREADGSGPVAALTIIPANIPGQNVSVTFDTITQGLGQAQPGVNPDAKAQSGNIEEVRALLSDVINNRIPDGFSAAPLQVGTARVGNFLMTPIRMLGGTDRDIFIYSLENVGSSFSELTEQSFYNDGVMGIAFWPLVKVNPGERTHVFILAAKRGVQ